MYPEIMYDLLAGLKNGRLINVGYGFGPEVQTEQNLYTALLETQHQPIIRHILSMDSCEDRAQQEILRTLITRGDFMMLLEVLEDDPRSVSQLRSEDLHEAIKQFRPADETILSILDIANQEEELEYYDVRKLIELCIETKRHKLASTIIDRFISSQRQPLARIVIQLQQKQIPTVEEMTQALDSLYRGIKEDDYFKRQEVDNAAKSLLSELETVEVAIPDLQKIVEACLKRGIRAYDLSNVVGKIRAFHLKRNDFEAAEAFIDLCGDREWELKTLARAKLVYGYKEGNQELCASARDNLVQAYDKTITEEEEKWKSELAELQKTESEEDEETSWRRENNAWLYRVCMFEARAMKAANLALYELRFGEVEQATAYVDEMIEHTEAIGIPGGPDCSKRDRGFLRKRRRSTKKAIKAKFMQFGMFDCLPSRLGWDHKILDPSLAQARAAERSKQRSAAHKKREKQDQLEREAEAMRITELAASTIPAEQIPSALADLKSGWSQRRSFCAQAQCILRSDPDQFATIYEILSEQFFKKENWYTRDNDWGGLGDLMGLAHQLGVLTPEHWEKFWEEVNKQRFHPDHGMQELFPNLVIHLVNTLIAQGDVAQAWEVFNQARDLGNGMYRGERAVGRGTYQICLGAFIRAVDQDKQQHPGIHAALTGAPPPENLSDTQAVEYWNTHTTVSAEDDDPEEEETPYQIARAQLIQSVQTPEQVRSWVRLLILDSMRSHHQVRSEAFEVCRQLTSQSAQRRIIGTLIKLRIPGMEACDMFKKKDTPLPTLKYFFDQLVVYGYFSQNTKRFLDASWKEHVPHLRQLLAGHQNEFNTVVDALVEYEQSQVPNPWERGDDQPIEIIPFKPEEWKHVFTVLRVVGTITLGIWREAKRVNFALPKLRALQEKIRVESEKLFTNEPLSEEMDETLLAELVYAAYRPANMSVADVSSRLKQVRDCSGHLDSYQFPADGYRMELQQRQEVTLRRGQQTDSQVRNLLTFDTPDVQPMGRALCEAGRLKFQAFEDDSEDVLFSLFEGDDFFFELRENYQQTISHSDYFQYLLGLQEFLNVYLEDNLAERIEEFFAEHPEQISNIWQRYCDGNNADKRKKVLEQQLGIDADGIDTTPGSGAEVIAQAILQKSKALKRLRKSVSAEIKKFVTPGGEEVSSASISLRAYISKNRASFFAKASAGICTHSDVDLFEREDHFHINTVDKENNICLGNTQAYEVQHNGQKVLLLRGFNPNTSLLKDLSPEAYCEAIISSAEEFARDNGFDAVFMTGQANFVALSNRPEIANYLMRRYGKNPEAFEFSIASSDSAKITEIFPLRRINEPEQPAPKPEKRKKRERGFSMAMAAMVRP